METVKVQNPLKALQRLGQSVWFDYVRRNLLTSGELTRLIKEDGLRGMTSNPSIFEKAIAGSTDYDAALQSLAQQISDAKALYEALAVADIQEAADLLQPIYLETKGRDGYVSLEVSPHLANDTKGTIAEAQRLWKLVARPNIMIKVPGTQAGLPAIEELIAQGININITLLFAQATYEKVAAAFIKGLERYDATGGDVSKIASVASFFVSRIDTLIDSMIDQKLKSTVEPSQKTLLNSLLGKVAIANAKLTYQSYKKIFSQDRWQKLEKKGAKTQRLLWASTSTKNPHYSDVLYVEELIGADTVNTMPPATFEAYRDHGNPAATLEQNLDQAKQVMSALSKVGISMADVCSQLVIEGVKLFADAFDKLLAALEMKRQSLSSTHLNTMSYHLDKALTDSLHATLKEWQDNNKLRKLWARDASLWTNNGEEQWLGWLDITHDQLAHLSPLKALSEDILNSGFKHVLLLGMGGSSLGPAVLKLTFSSSPGYPELDVLDSTDPAQIKVLEEKIDLNTTLFIVSSKSGTTLEPNIFKDYFFDKVKAKLGAHNADKRFIAITDPGSPLEKEAQANGFRYVFLGLPSIGGRYSVLSNFGMVPAAVLGIDITKLLDRTELMVHACAASVPAENNPGALLGIIMGVAAKQGRDKVTIVTSPVISAFGDWLEQLLAESTGKSGKGLIPINHEQLGDPQLYGPDRLFIYIRVKSSPDSAQDQYINKLQDAGQPVVRLSIEDIYDIGQEFFRWEFATATAGSVMGINAFNQPDVEASKVATRQLTAEYEKTGKLPIYSSLFEGDGFTLFADTTNAQAIKKLAGAGTSLSDYLRGHLDRIHPNDYCALLAYLEMNDKHEKLLQNIRLAIRNAKRIATSLEFGPRFLHSTGQAYKGGPNSGVFFQITADDAYDLAIPGKQYTFGIVKAAQACGDFQVLAQQHRRVLNIHSTGNLDNALMRLQNHIERALN